MLVDDFGGGLGVGRRVWVSAGFFCVWGLIYGVVQIVLCGGGFVGVESDWGDMRKVFQASHYIMLGCAGICVVVVGWERMRRLTRHYARSVV